MRIARHPKTGQFVQGNRGGPGRPPAGEMTKAELKRQRAIIAAWREQTKSGVDLLAHMTEVLDGPKCPVCGKALALRPYRTPRTFCSPSCAEAAVHVRRVGARRRNPLSKIARGVAPEPTELLALQCSRVDGET